MKVSLTSKTLKGKNKLQRDGNTFEVLCQKVPVFDKELHFCLQNINNKNHIRWIKSINDVDFELTILEEE